MSYELEFWTHGMGFPKTTAREAKQAEDDGWDGLALADSQNLTGDTYVALAMGAANTSRILLAPGVTNPLTRHPAAAATAIASIQEESDGRAVFGIGRGDSSLAHIGLAPMPVGRFVHYLERVQGYLRGEDVPFEVEADGHGAVASADALGMAGGPTASRLRWLKYAKQGTVPVHVVASGPKVIRSCAVVADGLIFAVGASTERLGWAIDLAKKAREDAGLDPTAIRFAALIPMATLADEKRAVELITPTLGSYVRFSVMHGKVNGPVSETQQETLENVHKAYDMNTHVRRGPQTDALSDEVVETFSITGSPAFCIDRLSELIQLGISKFLVHSGAPANFKDNDADGRRLSYDTILSDVIPALKKAS